MQRTLPLIYMTIMGRKSLRWSLKVSDVEGTVKDGKCCQSSLKHTISSEQMGQAKSWLSSRRFKASLAEEETVLELSCGELSELERCRCGGENPVPNWVRMPASEPLPSAGLATTTSCMEMSSSRTDSPSERTAAVGLTERTRCARRHSFIKASSSSSGVAAAACAPCVPSNCTVPRRWRSSKVACSATM